MRRIVQQILLFAVAVLAPAARFTDGIDAQRMIADVRLLSSDRYGGRWTGSKALDQAAVWIAKNFEKSGLRPPFTAAGQHPSYLQRLLVNTESKLGSKNTLSIGKSALTIARDYVPRVFSSSGALAAPLIFAGYGISSNDYHYDDYAGLDVKGKAVLVLAGEPQEETDNGAFLGKEATRYANLEGKAINAKMHGAAALIVINNSIIHPDEIDRLDRFGTEAGALSVGIPVLQVKSSIAAKWFDGSGHDLRGIVRAIDRTLQPQSFRFPASFDAKLHVEVERVMRPSSNVAAYLPGDTSEYIVIGAHYDHLGLGRQFSMSPNEAGKIHPGADDNASGTAAVLELARLFSGQPRHQRGILFATFTGEELGLLGSSHLAAHMPLPIENCVAMVNLDMVGRMRDKKLYIAGAATGSNFRGILDSVLAGDASVQPDFSDNLNIGGSDHTSFLSRQIPALFFFSGLHSDYHKPSDTFEKFDAQSYGQVIRLVAATVDRLANDSERPAFRRLDPPTAPGAPASGASGYGPYFGSVPDFAEQAGGGVRFSDIRASSPAEKAGAKPGDILIEFDRKPVAGLQDYTYLLRTKKPGDLVQIKVKRLDKILTFDVVLEARK